MLSTLLSSILNAIGNFVLNLINQKNHDQALQTQAVTEAKDVQITQDLQNVKTYYGFKASLVDDDDIDSKLRKPTDTNSTK